MFKRSIARYLLDDTAHVWQNRQYRSESSMHLPPSLRKTSTRDMNTPHTPQ